MKTRNRNVGIGLIGAVTFFLTLSGVLDAVAAPVTFIYSGEVSRQAPPFFDAGYAVGTPLTFQYTFDPDQVTRTFWEGTVNASPFVYEWTSVGWSFEMQVGSDTYSADSTTTAQPFDIRVEDNSSTADRYGVRVRPTPRFEFPNGTGSPLIQMFLAGTDGTLFSDFSLPTVAPVAGGVVGSFFGAHLQASIAGPAAPSPVPLPTALPLFGTGLGFVAFLGWRRKRTARA